MTPPQKNATVDSPTSELLDPETAVDDRGSAPVDLSPSWGERLRASGFSRIAGISASLMGTQALTSLLGLVFWALAARVFLTSEVGVAGAAIALMMFLGGLGSFGLGTVLIARLPATAADERRVLVRTCVAAAFAVGAVLGLVVPVVAVHLFGVTALAPIAGSVWPLLAFGLGTGLTASVIVLDQAVLTVGVGNLQLQRNVTASAVKIVALIVLGLAGAQGGMIIFVAWAIGNLVSLPVVALRSRPRGPRVPDGRRLIEPALLRGIGRLALSHHALNVSIQAALQVLPVIVVILVSASANAAFTAATMLAGFVFALPYAISVGLFAAARGEVSEVVARMRLTIPVGLAISAAASLVLFPLAGPLLHIFGPAYVDDGTVLLRLIVLAGIPFVIKDHFIALRRVQGRTTQALVVTGIFLVLELAAAAVGAQLGGAAGLIIGWLTVLVVEALVLAVPLLTALRSAREGGIPAVVATAPAATTTVAPAAAAPAATVAVVSAVPATTTSLEQSQLEGAAERRPSPASATPPAISRLGALSARTLTGPTLLVMSLGVLLMAGIAAAGRAGASGALVEFGWIAGLVIIFVPAAVRIIAPSTSTAERVAVAIGLGMILQVSRLVLNPTSFVFHDELIHAETLRQIDETGHLFSYNPLLPVAAYYPGLEVVTSGVEQLTGLPAFAAATIVLLAARLIMVLGIIALVRAVTGSYRAGALGVLVYVANPQLLFFNSQYSYQTLALPLALLAVYLVAVRRRGRWTSLLLPAGVTATVMFTHHLTGALLVAAFAVWLVLVLVRGRRSPEKRAAVRDVGLMTAWGAGLLALSVANPGNPLATYLGAIVGSSGSDLLGLAEGAGVKPLFADGAGTGPVLGEQILLIAAVLIAMASMLIALGYLRSSWRAARPFALLLGLVALLYPVIPGGHVAQATAEVGDRAAGFVFIGLAVVIATWWWKRRRTARIRVAFVVGLTVMFLGNVVLGAGPTSGQLPGDYQISADARSIDSDNLAAADWQSEALPRDSVVYGDRTSGLLAAAVGGQETVLHVSTSIDASRLLLAPTYTSADLQLIDATELDYLIVDTRMSQGLPHQQVYIESGEFGEDGRTEPVSPAALEKFAAIRGVDRLYDNGSLVIYDVRRLR